MVRQPWFWVLLWALVALSALYTFWPEPTAEVIELGP